MEFSTATDGRDHINVSKSGTTMLGLMLDLDAYTPVEFPNLGRFASMEGLWVWLSTGRRHAVLQHLYGGNAFSSMCSLGVVYDAERDAIIHDAWSHKLRQTPVLKLLFDQNRLPFASYGHHRYNPHNDELHRWAFDHSVIVQQLSHLQECYAIR